MTSTQYHRQVLQLQLPIIPSKKDVRLKLEDEGKPSFLPSIFRHPSMVPAQGTTAMLPAWRMVVAQEIPTAIQ